MSAQGAQGDVAEVAGKVARVPVAVGVGVKDLQDALSAALFRPGVTVIVRRGG
ncbi:hypothetical protein ACFV7R_41655 [Streptomyces sp. NPDC059866]|uniref:hypothetical protein n=1 Tax=Streptomyces sp. NPDC059866 TaxID=3346978 RepID=UPI00364FF641